MVATVILGMLCMHLMCFCLMFVLISTRLQGKTTMGMEVFALGNLLLGLAYLLQLTAGSAGWSVWHVLNHTLTLCAPVAYGLGSLRFFNRPTHVWQPLLTLALTYSAVQVLVQWWWGPTARHALLAASCTLLFATMAGTAWYGARTFAQDLRIEMYGFAVLIGGISGLNAAKCVALLQHGLATLDMQSPLQTGFYLYMSFLGTVLPPSIVWLVLRRLTDELRSAAERDPLTQLLNRRGLVHALEQHFHPAAAPSMHVLMLDIDHFKRINDTYGHQVGDQVLCQIARILQATARPQDLIARLGGEEFVVLCPDGAAPEMQAWAEHLRQAIAQCRVHSPALLAPIHCTATLGLGGPVRHPQALDWALQQADTALYRGKALGRNRVEGPMAAAGLHAATHVMPAAVPHV